MKLKFEDTTTSVDNIQREEFFKITNPAVIFEILRDKLYNNKILAVCREYLSNARDAHIEVGKNSKPIEVSLPTSSSPYWKVRDFGPGISPDRMADIFVNYGASTKRETNEQTGAFGIGGKSGFAYSDVFSVISIHDGKRRHYNAYIDETRIGKMALMSEADSKEESGTEVIIPVKAVDFNDFSKFTSEIVQYWDPQPKVLTGKLQTKQVTFIHHNPLKWSLLTNHHNGYYTDRHAIAVIGGIGYKIFEDRFSSLDRDERLFLKNNILIYFNNGDVALAASRDSIAYTEETQKVIKEKIKEIKSDIIKHVDSLIESASNYRSAVSIYEKYYNEISFLRDKEFYWKKNKIVSTIYSDQIGKYAKVYEVQERYNYKDKTYKEYMSSYSGYNLLNNKDNILYYEGKNNLLESLKQYCATNKLNIRGMHVVWLNPKPAMPKADKETAVISYDKEKLKLLEIKELPIVSDKKEIKKRLKKADDSILGYDLSDTESSIKNIENKGGIYIPLQDNKIMALFNTTKYNYYIDVKSISKILGKPIFGFTKRSIASLSKEWKTLDTVINEKIKELGGIEKINSIYKQMNYASSVRLPELDYLFSSADKEIVNKDSTLLLYLNKSKALESELNSLDLLTKLISFKRQFVIENNLLEKPTRYSVKEYGDPVVKEIAELYNKLNSKYELLQYFGHHTTLKAKKAIYNYINLIDKQ